MRIIRSLSQMASHNLDIPNGLWCPIAHLLALGTDSGALHFYDLSQSSFLKPTHTYQPHDDDISSLTALSSAGAQRNPRNHFITTGSSSVAITDLRKGVLRERDMGEEIFSSCPFPPNGVAIGGERGILRFWTDTQKLSTELESFTETRIRLAKNESIDSLCALPNQSKLLAAGVGDGSIKVVDLRLRKVIHDLQHDEIEPVIGLGFESEGRLISAGGPNVKVWQESTDGEPDNEELDEEDSEVDQASQESDDEQDDNKGGGRPRKRRKKRKKGNGIGASNGILGIKGLV